MAPTNDPTPVADAPRGNWVDRYAPARTRPFLRLSRADRPIGTWLLWLPCLWGLALAAAGRPGHGFGPYDLWLTVSCGIGAFLMRGAGCTWNDITDRAIDAAVARTRSRPIPSGQVGVKTALIWAVLQTAIAGVVLITYPAAAIFLAIASLALVGIYPYAKRFTWWPQVFLGLAFNWGIFVLWAAGGAGFGVAPVLAYGAAIFWTLFYDTIYALQDKEDDALIGVKSTARLFGAQTPLWLGGFLMGAVALLSGAVIAAYPVGWGLGLALLGVAGFGGHLWWQLRQLRPDDAAQCLRLFRANRDAGGIVALFLAVAATL